ncbi:MAG: helix-turn-helix transcriptional regulator [Candidatus Omnitrophota bacterium]
MEKKNIYHDLGVRVKKIRKELGISQEKLAFKARISPTFLSHIERGSKKASLRTVQKLAAALNVPVQNLFSPPGEPVAYLKTEEDLFLRRLKGLIGEKGEDFKKLLYKMASYLAEREG